MGTFSSGTGLISGFDIEGYVEQIMKIEGATRDKYKTRVEDNTAEIEAVQELQNLVKAVQLQAANFNTLTVFENKTSSSSNEDAISATTKKWADTGTYQFVVKSLATSHQFVSRNSYTSRTSSVGTGTISFEVGQGQLARDTELTSLNGRSGIQRGKFQITDKAGTTSVIDLTTALSINDVIKAINSSNSSVSASVSGDGLVITDESGGTGNLIISEYGDGQTASDLGILQNTSSSKIFGEDIISLSGYTLLSDVNDGNGVRDLSSGITISSTDGSIPDAYISFAKKIDGDGFTIGALNSGSGVRLGKFNITNRNGSYTTIDVSEMDPNTTTLDGLIAEINRQATDAGMNLTFTYEGKTGITVVDNSEALTTDDDGTRKSNFIIEDIEGGNTAADLGIEYSTSSSTISGQAIWKMDTLSDVMAAINNSTATNFYGNHAYTASIDSGSNNLKITSQIAGSFTITSNNNGHAAEDLGIATGGTAATDVLNGKAIVAGLNTVLLSSLNGGSGGATESDTYGDNRITSGGVISLTDGAGNTSEIDLTNAVSVQDVLDKINNLYDSNNSTNIRAALNSNGNGIVLTDSSSSGSMAVADVSGNMASLLNLAGTATGSVNSGNLQLQYVSEATAISNLRNGTGITRGTFSITDSDGTKKSINLSQDSITTVGDIIDTINNAGLKIEARINDTGDGIILVDTSTAASGAKQPIKVTDNSSGTAAELGLLARDSVKDENGNYYIDGSFELTLDLGGSDDLDDVAERVNEAGLGISASVVNDGTGYRLSFASETSGRKGTIYFDAGNTGMKTDNVTTAKDAIILLGDGSEEHPMLINSSTNSIKDAIYGTTLNIKKVSQDPVTITIEDDVDGMVEKVTEFVDAYNAVMEYIAEVTAFDAETYEKGILFADSTVSTVKQQMVSLVQRTFGTDTGSYKTMSSIGLKFEAMTTETKTDASGKTTTYATAGGLSLAFDEETFKEAFGAEPKSVASLFNTADKGISDYINDLLDQLASTSNENSTIQNRINSINDANDLLETRITSIEEQLASKEDRMYSEFYAMEETLAKLQTQQKSISSLSSLTSA